MCVTPGAGVREGHSNWLVLLLAVTLLLLLLQLLLSRKQGDISEKCVCTHTELVLVAPE